MEKLIIRVEQLLQQGQKVLSTRRKGDWTDYVDYGQIKGFRAASLSFIERVYGKNHSHYTEFNTVVNSDSPGQVEAGISILEVIKDEISGGWIFTLKGLVTAEIFSDFLEMSEYFLGQGFKDPSAVMAGSVLEEHLRQLAIKNEIPIEQEKNDKVIYLKADRINSEIAKAGVYGKLDQKTVTTWLDLRNKAAHGEYDQYTKDQVALMLQGITDFMTRVPV